VEARNSFFVRNNLDVMSSGKKGQMIVKKRSSQKEKRKTKPKESVPANKNGSRNGTHAEPPGDQFAEETSLKDLVLMGDEVADPDINMLAQQENEFIEDDPISIKNPEVAAELSEDPVRLYLREIGQVKLLDSDSEFRLATIIEASRFVGMLRRRPLTQGLSYECSIYHVVLDEMHTAWERLLEDADRLHYELPDPGLILTEAQTLHEGWQSDAPSYLRAYLDNGHWGIDQLWDNLARNVYSVFLSLYLFPLSYAEWLLKHLNQNQRLPNQ
jgi:RNA polymerase primary sigma factor